MDGAPLQLWNEEIILETPNTMDLTQPAISGDGEGEIDGDAKGRIELVMHVMHDINK